MSSIGATSATVTAQSPVQQAPAPMPPAGEPTPPPKGPGPAPAPPWGGPVPAPPTLPPGGHDPQLPDTAPPKPPVLPPSGETPGWPLPPSKPPVPTEPPGWPQPPTDPTTPPTVPTPPPTEPGDGGRNILPWVIGGAALLAAGVGGYLAIKDGARNLRALDATARSFESGAMHQGGLHAIHDAGLGARFADGIGLGDKLLVTIPGINRIGTGGRLTAVARGHLDHAELMAATTALRRQAGDAVGVHAPLQQHVLDALESGRGLPSVLDDLDRSAAGARPVFSNPRMVNYWDQASIVERGRGRDVVSAVSRDVPELALSNGSIVETGHLTRIDDVVAARGARLGERGLASGVGSIQAANVDTLPPALRERAIAASRVDPKLVEEIGLQGAYVQRWTDRLAQGAQTAASEASEVASTVA